MIPTLTCKVNQTFTFAVFFNEGYSVKQRKTPNALFVEISKLQDKASQEQSMFAHC